ncbi:MAG TPA: hypothetical protein VI056_07810 [Candidatus Limnocylindria bacterium]
MITGEIPARAELNTEPEHRIRGRSLRVVLLVTVVLLVVGLVVLAGLSGLAADPMTGT